MGEAAAAPPGRRWGPGQELTWMRRARRRIFEMVVALLFSSTVGEPRHIHECRRRRRRVCSKVGVVVRSKCSYISKMRSC